MNNIPKIIHYCWFGPKKIPLQFIRNIETWKQCCPDWKIIKWDESNFDYKIIPYTKQAYETGHFGFVSDVARLFALYNHGGVYLDTDIKLYRNLIDFCGLSGFAFIDITDGNNLCHTSIMGSTVHNAFIGELMDEYYTRMFIKTSGHYDVKDNIQFLTEKCKRHGFIEEDRQQNLGGFVMLPSKSVYQRQSYKSKKPDDWVYAYHTSTSLCYTKQDKRCDKMNALQKALDKKFDKGFTQRLYKSNIWQFVHTLYVYGPKACRRKVRRKSTK